VKKGRGEEKKSARQKTIEITKLQHTRERGFCISPGPEMGVTVSLENNAAVVRRRL